MLTVVFVHAHPDDEASQTAGTMTRLSAEGHRVVLVYATGGELGAQPDGLAGNLADHRRREAEASADLTGTQRIVWLGHHDSGMTGWAQNDAEEAFVQVDVEDAARAVAAVLDEEDADVVVGYDWHGGYGHPDHIQVHRVTARAAELAQRRPRYLEVSMNRTRMIALAEMAPPEMRGEWDPTAPMDDGNPIGSSEDELHWSVDVQPQLAVKRAALRAHASQPDAAQLLALPEPVFAAMLGHESYLEPGRPRGMVEAWPF